MYNVMDDDDDARRKKRHRPFFFSLMMSKRRKKENKKKPCHGGLIHAEDLLAAGPEVGFFVSLSLEPLSTKDFKTLLASKKARRDKIRI